MSKKRKRQHYNPQINTSRTAKNSVIGFYIHHKPCKHNVTWLFDATPFPITMPMEAISLFYQSIVNDLTNDMCIWCKEGIALTRTYFIQNPPSPPFYGVYQGWKSNNSMGYAQYPPPETREF